VKFKFTGTLSCEKHCKICNHTTDPGRQHDCDAVARALPPHVAAERDARREQRAGGHGTMIHSVDDCRVPGVLFQSTQACFTKMPTQVVALLVTEFAERQEALAHCGDVRLLAGNRVAEGHGHRIRNAPRPFDEIATALERKDGTPELIHPDRHDRTLRSAGDEFVATLEPQQDAGTREFALGKMQTISPRR
jgi:hypothetical protein